MQDNHPRDARERFRTAKMVDISADVPLWDISKVQIVHLDLETIFY